jgi:hypothetical protein
MTAAWSACRDMTTLRPLAVIAHRSTSSLRRDDVSPLLTRRQISAAGEYTVIWPPRFRLAGAATLDLITVVGFHGIGDMDRTPYIY